MMNKFDAYKISTAEMCICGAKLEQTTLCKNNGKGKVPRKQP